MQHQYTTEFYTMDDIAKRFGVHKNTVRAWCSKGMIPEPISINSQSLFWRKDTFDRFIKSKESKL